MTKTRKAIINKIKRKTDFRYTTREIEQMYKECGKDSQTTIEVLRLASWRDDFFEQKKVGKLNGFIG